MRHLDQIISIPPSSLSSDSVSAELLPLTWRLGGGGGTVRFPDPSDQFYAQHSAKELPNGNILLFDNGNRRPAEEGGEYTRFLELQLAPDPLNPGGLIAQKVWEYRPTPDLFSTCCSNVSRLENGNTVGIFGSDFDRGVCCRIFTLVEADPTGQTVWKVELRSPGQNVQYRIYPIYGIDGEMELP